MNAQNQTIDLGISRNEVAESLVNAGYWESTGHQGNRRYVLSPSAFVLSREQQVELSRLATALYPAVGALNNRLCDIAQNEKGRTHQDGMFLRLGNTAARGLLDPVDGCRMIPPLLKVDLMQNECGDFKIAEVDVYNPRGLGYNALLNEMGAGLAGKKLYPGMDTIARLLREASDRRWVIVVSAFEQYYRIAFEIFARAMSRRGVDICVIDDAHIRDNKHVLQGGAVLIVPDSLHTHAAAREQLMEWYRDHSMRTFYPPVAYLGSKAFLPFLRACAGMEAFLPECGLVGKRWTDPREQFSGPYVLKAGVSSGLKGVFFSNLDAEAFEKEYATARSLKTGSWVLQQQVTQQAVPVTIFGPCGVRSTKHFYLRLTIQVGESGVVDAEVTGRTDPKVHGAPDCIQLPVVLE